MDLDCLNPQCERLNGQIGKWRKTQGAKGGQKGWCFPCLKFERDKFFKTTF